MSLSFFYVWKFILICILRICKKCIMIMGIRKKCDDSEEVDINSSE